MFKKNKKKFKKNRRFNDEQGYRKEVTTFDPKIHHRSRGNPGYGLRRDVSQPDEELLGSTLQGMFDKWDRRD